MNAVRIGSVRVCIEHDEVGFLARFKTANFVFEPDLPSCINGVGANGLVNAQSLVCARLHGVVGRPSALSCNRHFNIKHGVERVFANPRDRVVAAQGDPAAIAMNGR